MGRGELVGGAGFRQTDSNGEAESREAKRVDRMAGKGRPGPGLSEEGSAHVCLNRQDESGIWTLTDIAQ